MKENRNAVAYKAKGVRILGKHMPRMPDFLRKINYDDHCHKTPGFDISYLKSSKKP